MTIGRRPVASALRIMARGPERDFTNDRLLNRDAWSCRRAGRILLELILAILLAHLPLVLAGDDIVERRNGRKIRAKGFHHDAVRSRKSTQCCASA